MYIDYILKDIFKHVEMNYFMKGFDFNVMNTFLKFSNLKDEEKSYSMLPLNQIGCNLCGINGKCRNNRIEIQQHIR